MTRTALIDTNILVYSYEQQDQVRQANAFHVLSRLQIESAGFLSVKTLSEFFVVIRRIPNPLSNAQALAEMQKHMASWPVFDLTSAIVIEAARGVHDYGFSYWDAQMWATAKLNGISDLFTEDMHVGSIIEGVSITNPLTTAFDFEKWFAGK